jgi:IS5 family transposase
VQQGDALHAVLCAAGFNIRWLLRAIVRLGLGAVFLRLCALLGLFHAAGQVAQSARGAPESRPSLAVSLAVMV